MHPLRSGSQGNASVAPPSIDALRQRARHRLIGAALLVVLGVVGFSLLLDTQPRPLPVDIPIVIPAKPVLSAPSSPAVPAAASTASAGSDVAAADSLGPREAVVGAADQASASTAPPPVAAPTAGATARSAAPAVQKPSAASSPSPVTAQKTAPSAAPAKTPAPASATVAKPDAPKNAQPAGAKATAQPDAQPQARPVPSPGDGERARALLNGQNPDAVAARRERVIVQVGAFADATRAREVRTQLERAGLKTYTHVAETAEGRRIRVRLGPFTTRADADKAAARVKALGLPAAILTL